MNVGNVPHNKGKTKDNYEPLRRAGIKISKANKGKKCWSKGLTKETDERVRIGGVRGSKTKKRLFKEGELIPFHGKGNPSKRPEIAKKISEHFKKLWRNPEFRKKMLKSFQLKERNRKISVGRKKHLKNHPNEGFQKGEGNVAKTPEVRKKIKKSRQYVPLFDTKTERIVQAELIKLGVRFEKHRKIFGRPDIFIRPNLCVFVDGCLWHLCEKCHDLKELQGRLKFYNKLVKKKKNDSVVTRKLIKRGYKVLRFPEHRIQNNLQGCIDEILSELNNVNQHTLNEFL